jgi:hypothetical protein
MENERKQKINGDIQWNSRRLYLKAIFNRYQKGAHLKDDNKGDFT